MTKTLFRFLATASLAAILTTSLRTGWSDDQPTAPVTFPSDAPALSEGDLRCRVQVRPVGLNEAPVALVELENRGRAPLEVLRDLIVTQQGALAISRVPQPGGPVEVQRLQLEAKLAPGERRVLELRLDAALTAPERLFGGEYALSVVPHPTTLTNPIAADPTSNTAGQTFVLHPQRPGLRLDPTRVALRPSVLGAPSAPALARFRVDPARVLGVETELVREDGRVMGVRVTVENLSKQELQGVFVRANGLGGVKVQNAAGRRGDQGLTIAAGASREVVLRVHAAPASGRLLVSVSGLGLARQVEALGPVAAK
ncbi:MAG: hypothetical protein AB7N76_11960 [Planctomycetota bacterium]